MDQGCASFPFSESQILWSLCSVIFNPLTLKLPIQTSLSVAPKLPAFLRASEQSETFMKTSTPQHHVILKVSLSSTRDHIWSQK